MPRAIHFVALWEAPQNVTCRSESKVHQGRTFLPVNTRSTASHVVGGDGFVRRLSGISGTRDTPCLPWELEGECRGRPRSLLRVSRQERVCQESVDLAFTRYRFSLSGNLAVPLAAVAGRMMGWEGNGGPSMK